MTQTNTYNVTGMTCAHCVNSVTEEVTAIPEVERVKIDLENGTLTVTASEGLSDDDIRTAVEEAGYDLA